MFNPLLLLPGAGVVMNWRAHSRQDAAHRRQDDAHAEMQETLEVIRVHLVPTPAQPVKHYASMQPTGQLMFDTNTGSYWREPRPSSATLFGPDTPQFVLDGSAADPDSSQVIEGRPNDQNARSARIALALWKRRRRVDGQEEI